MRTVLVFAAMALALGCATPEERQHDKLMDVIEAYVKMPDGARPLSEYARHYAVDEKGLVIGVYAPGYRAPSPDETCEEVLENMTSRQVPCADAESDRLQSGQRQWVGDTDKLPLIMDGGCAVVTVIYDPKASAVKSATCNGVL